MSSRVGIGRVLRRLLRYARPHVGVLLASFLAMAVLAVCNAAFALLTGPALTFVLSGGAAASTAHSFVPWAGRLVPRSALAIPVAIALLAVVKGLAYLGQFYASGLFGQKVVADVRREFFVKICALSPLEVGEHRSGDLLSRFSSDMAAVELAAVYALPSYIRDGLQVAALGMTAVALNYRLALGTLLLAPLGLLPASLLTRVVLRRTREAQGRLGALAAQLKEGLAALRTVQAFDAFEVERLRFEAETSAHRRALVRAAWARGVVPSLMELLGALGIAGVLAWVGGRSGVSPEALVSFLVTLVLLYQPIKELGRSTQFAQGAAAAGERIFAVLDSERAVRDRPGAALAPVIQREVRFVDVRFAYGARPALQGLSLTVPAGRVAALVGPSGAGKSTVTALLLRFASPDAGAILLDGRPLDDFTADSVRGQVALVTQEPLLFAGTVLQNLRVARPAATLAEVERAARVARADAFIQELPRGYDTPLGERGVKLSGGQKQRLCLARALLSGASLLVLDEATSALDPESEREVQEALPELLQGRTALLIAHRLSTVMGADAIHVLDGGRVVESGSHPELLERQGLYASLWRLQTQGAAGASAA